MKPISPTLYSMKRLAATGWKADKVEQRLPIPGSFVTRDAFGFGDILACHEVEGILLVQATSRSNVKTRINKVTDLTVEGKSNKVRAALITWLRAGGRFEVWGWDLTPEKTWRLRRVVFGYTKGHVPGHEIGWHEP